MITREHETGQIIREAKGLGIELHTEEIRRDGDFPTIDGMDAYEWLDAMTGGRGRPSRCHTEPPGSGWSPAGGRSP